MKCAWEVPYDPEQFDVCCSVAFKNAALSLVFHNCIGGRGG